MTPTTELFPPIEPFACGRLAVDSLHTLYWEQVGRHDGLPVLFLHGGPGDGCSPRARQLFDPQVWNAVLFDQRGSGRSTPLGELTDNSTAQLVADIERLRQHLGIDRWLVFGGSWGSTLALAYAQAHPQRVNGLILRGIFLGTQHEIDWFMHGMGRFFPEERAAFLSPIPLPERADLLVNYYRRLCDDSQPDVQMAACRAWSAYEAACCTLLPNPDLVSRAQSDTVARVISRLEAHYFMHQCFLAEQPLLTRIDVIRQLPAVIVQGRYDVVCPPETAATLAAAWPEADYRLIEAAGHSMGEPGIQQALLTALAEFAARLCRA